MNDVQAQRSSRHLESLSDALHTGTFMRARMMLNGLHPAEIAHLLESLPQERREIVWEMVSPEYDGDVLTYVNDEVRASLIRDMEQDELIAATEFLDVDDLADILLDLPEDVVQTVLQSMDVQRRQRLEAVLSYPEDTAGGLMNTDTLTLRQDVTLDVVLRYLRRLGEIPETTDNLIVVNRDNIYLGVVYISDLLTKDPTLSVSEVMDTSVEGFLADQPAKEVASMFEQRDLISAPVIDERGMLLGRITIDDVVDVIRDEADHSFMSMAGLNEDTDMFAPIFASTRRRTPWLGINLLTALLASWVIGHFDESIEKLVALAILMPVVASMGGIAGSQTLTLVIRGMALGQISYANAGRLLSKELAIGALSGTLWALILAFITFFWFGDYKLGLIIAAAIVINLITAALAGATIPLLIRKFGADPALAGGVVLTTITDVIGFVAFLGLATLFLL
jgi:magnesium transporter